MQDIHKRVSVQTKAIINSGKGGVGLEVWEQITNYSQMVCSVYHRHKWLKMSIGKCEILEQNHA